MSDLISRQDAIDEIREVYEYEFPTASGEFDEFVVLIIPNILRNLPSAESERKWIPVTEALPEEKGEYLVSYHPCHWNTVSEKVLVGMDTFRGKTTWAKKKYQKVIAWMPLPEVYRGE